jgi:hypothetical protein
MTYTPEQSKRIITDLLSLGTLKGVKVVYEDITGFFFLTPTGNVILEYGGEVFESTEDDHWYSDIQSIEPIPMEPKLLEVGTRVKIIGGEHEGEVMEIADIDEGEYFLVNNAKDINFYKDYQEAHYNVIPESLLVEEEESKAEKIASIIGYRGLRALTQAGYKIVKK